MHWKHRIAIKHLLTGKEDYHSVADSMAQIAEEIEKYPFFTGFSTHYFRRIPEGDDILTPLDYANKLLDRLYDFADIHRIWIE